MITKALTEDTLWSTLTFSPATCTYFSSYMCGVIPVKVSRFSLIASPTKLNSFAAQNREFSSVGAELGFLAQLHLLSKVQKSKLQFPFFLLLKMMNVQIIFI